MTGEWSSARWLFFLLKQLYPPSRSGDLPLPLHTKPSSWTSTNAAGRLERRRSAAAGVVFWQFINGRQSLNWNNIEQQQQCPMSNGCLFSTSFFCFFHFQSTTLVVLVEICLCVCCFPDCCRRHIHDEETCSSPNVMMLTVQKWMCN